MGMGVLLQTGVHVVSGMFGHGARSCGQTLLMLGIAPMSSGRRWSRYANIAQATDWLICLLHWYAGEMRLTRSAEYAEVDIAPS